MRTQISNTTLPSILLTGACGYIGCHTWVELIQNGYHVVGIDNFSNSHPKVLERIEYITGIKPIFYPVDIADYAKLYALFEQYNFNALIHFAAYKAVGESVQKPLSYYENNIAYLIQVIKCIQNFYQQSIQMQSINVDNFKFNFIFSSSATVYGQPKTLPLSEDAPLSATNPYGHTKLMAERILQDYAYACPWFKLGILRYFNPVGAHISGEIGEVPQGIPNNIMPYINQVAIGLRPQVNIFGADYETPDGTGIRDYIHIMDLAQGHLRALEYLQKQQTHLTVNLGTGQGYSVLDLIHAFSKISKKDIPYVFAPRREGDIASCYADANLAFELMQWQASYNLEDMCLHAWNWQQKYPRGYC
jgi:UDP-glucose 4-epimerase